MPDSLSDLGFDVNTIERDQNFSRDVGVASLKSAHEPPDEVSRARHIELNLALSATHFRRAGAHGLLLGNMEAAFEFFHNAGEAYARLPRPYALMMWALAGDRAEHSLAFTLARDAVLQNSDNRSIHQQWAYTLLFSAANGLRPSDMKAALEKFEMPGLLADLDASRASPIGILGVPLGAYLDLADSLSGSTDDLEETLVPFFNAYDIAVRQARTNTYQWRRAALPFHPVEPDVFSVFVLAHSALQRKERSILSLIERLVLSKESRIIINNTLPRLLSGRRGHHRM